MEGVLWGCSTVGSSAVGLLWGFAAVWGCLAPCKPWRGGGRTRLLSPSTRRVRCPSPRPYPAFRDGVAALGLGRAGARRCPPAPVLLALAGLAAAGEPAGSRSDWAVGALLGLLLCLVVVLALAWHHLCRLSAGRYHPRPMGRRALALLRGCWHRLRGRGDPAMQPCLRDGEVAAVVAAAPQDEEEELMPWSQDQRPEEEEEEKQEEEDEEEEEEAEAAPESPPGGGEAAGGSAEALLSDLHAFSGTAAWGEARPHVTAL
ncbi:protein tyrosine phosphatase receptor type C-associated protein [Sarcoramphus papa]